jgi:hypothetical protein
MRGNRARGLAALAALVIIGGIAGAGAWATLRSVSGSSNSLNAPAPMSGTPSATPTGPPLAVSAQPAGPISVTPSPVTGPGMSPGRATLSLTQPESATSSFDVGCIWSVPGHVVGLAIGKQIIGGDYPFLRWSLAPGPKYEIEFVEPDQTSFIGSVADFSSQAVPDGSTGSITFTNLVLNSGDPATAPRRSGTFTWACEPTTSLGIPAPSLPSPTVDEQGVPTLWILQNGAPVRAALTGCPVELTTPAGSLAESCATSDWWEPLALLKSAVAVSPGASLAFAIDGWTITSAKVVASLSTSLPGSVDNPLQDLHAVLGNGAVTFSAPATGSWYVHFTLEAATDDGSTLDAEYSDWITVP